MKEIFENRDLSGSVFHNVNLSQVTFEDVNLSEATIRNANLGNLSIEDAYIGGLKVFGFRIDQLIEDELDRRDPERVRLRMADPYDLECVKAVLRHLDEVRAEFCTFLRSTDPALLITKPAPDQWSALENVRHLVFAEDLYLNRWLLQNQKPMSKLGVLPSFLAGDAGYSEVGSQPTDDLATVLAAWEELHAQTWQFVGGLTSEELRRDTSQRDFGQGTVGKILQGLAQHDLVHIRQAQAALELCRPLVSTRGSELKMERMVAYCGIVCTDCPGYLATQADDQAELERLAERSRTEYHRPEITVEWVMCDGCLSASERKCAYCAECTIRACGLERGVVNCAYCPDYACQKLIEFFGMVPAARAVLDEIHAAL